MIFTINLEMTVTQLILLVMVILLKEKNRDRGATALTSDDFSTAERNTYSVVTTSSIAS